MTCPTDRLMDVLIGLDYEALLSDEDYGHHFPQFPPEANPELVYAYDLNQKEDADIYHIVNNELLKSLERSKNGSNN